MLLATPKICILIVYSNCRSFHSKKYKFSTHVSTTWPSFYCHCHNVQVKLELWLMLSAICLAMTKFTMKIHVLTCPPIVSRQIYGIVSRYSKSAERDVLIICEWKNAYCRSIFTQSFPQTCFEGNWLHN